MPPKFGKLSSGPRTRKSQFSFQSQRRAMPKKLKIFFLVLWRSSRPYRTNTKNDGLLIIGDWNAKEGNQKLLQKTGVRVKFGLRIQNEARQRLTELCQENALVIANTLLQQHKRQLYTWPSPDDQYWNQIDYILCSQNGEFLYSQQKQDQIMNSLL